MAESNIGIYVFENIKEKKAYYTVEVESNIINYKDNNDIILKDC